MGLIIRDTTHSKILVLDEDITYNKLSSFDKNIHNPLNITRTIIFKEHLLEEENRIYDSLICEDAPINKPNYFIQRIQLFISYILSKWNNHKN